MVIAIHLFAIATALALLFVALIFTAETLASFFGEKKAALADEAAGPAVILVPAHNEAELLPATLENVKSQMRKTDRILVVADNCDDNTAEIALSHGAQCVIRTDPVRRGKGYALQYGLDAMRPDPPALVVIVDADCVLEEGALSRICAASASEDRPAQALYLMKAPEGAEPQLRVAEFAWLFLNKIRMLGLQRLFDVTRFTGAGMAMPWRIAAELDLASGEIVEDLALSFEFAKRDAAAKFIPQAVITSRFPEQQDAQTRQAARWSLGSLAYAARSGASQLAAGVKSNDKRLIALALDLFIPPLTIFIAALFLVFMVACLSWALGAGAALSVILLAGGLTGFSLLTVWLVYGRDALPPEAFAGLARFLASKLRVFGAKGRASVRTWTPTRDAGPDDAA